MEKYNKNILEKIIKESASIAEVLRKLGVKPSGGNYVTIKKHIRKFNFDTSHFTGKLWSKGQKLSARYSREIPLEDIITNNIIYTNTHDLKLKLLKYNIFEYKCQNCNLVDWCGEKIPLELHHIDGDRFNNQLDNLLILCPNCHALTKNYRGKNK